MMSDEEIKEESNALVAGEAAPAEEPAADVTDAALRLYGRDDILVFSVGDEMCMVYSKLRRASQVVPGHLIRLLEYCQPFRTLDQHAAVYAHSLAPEGEGVDEGLVESAKNQLIGLAGRGLLVAEEELRGWHRSLGAAGAAGAKGVSIETIGVVTRDRTESLRRCVASYAENCRRHGRAPRFVVADDSAGAGTRGQNRKVLAALREAYGVRIEYAGREEKERFAAELAAAGDAPAEVIDFALFGVEGVASSVGANRNALLLDTAGGVGLSVDDDTICRVAEAPAARGELSLDASWDAMKYWFFPDRESALGSTTPAERDMLEIHEQLLGRDLRGCVAAFDQTQEVSAGLHFERVDAKSLRDMERDRGRVLATFTGVIGDSGLGTPYTYFTLGADTRERLVSSEEAYRSAFTSREVVRAIDRPRVSPNAWCLTTAYGFDNRELLPPFMTVGWGEDDLWGRTVQLCCEDGYFGYLPWVVAHDPHDARLYPTGSALASTASLRNYQIVAGCLASFQAPPGLTSDAERMRALGSHLVRLGEMRQADFEEHARWHVWRRQSEHIMYLEDRLRYYGSTPEFWAADVRRYIGTLRETLSKADYFVAEDLRAGRSDDEARRLAQQSVRKFGLLMSWWPRLTEVAKTLRERGRQLATPL